MTEFFVVLFAILCVDVTYRICTASARDWKHSKSYCRQCRAETPRWRKLLGLYPDGDCKAPHHLRSRRHSYETGEQMLVRSSPPVCGLQYIPTSLNSR